MAYDEHLAERIRQSLKRRHVSFEEKKMFGGISFLAREKVFVGILSGSMIVKIDPSLHAAAFKKKGCHRMVFGGRTITGYLGVDPEGVDKETDMDYWIDLSLEYNKTLQPVKKKKAAKKK